MILFHSFFRFQINSEPFFHPLQFIQRLESKKNAADRLLHRLWQLLKK